MLIPLKLVRDQRLQQQIFEQLRELIVSARLRPGARMPSSRMMAEQFAISRMTVMLTYERLIAEGYLETRPAAGTFVARPAVHTVSPAAVDASALSLAHPPAPPHASESGNGAGPPTPPHRAASAFAVPETSAGGSDPALFPAQRWRSLMRAGLDRMATQPAAEHPGGSPVLREAIAAWLSTSRGLAVSPDQVLPMKSRQQALHVAARLASRPCEGRRAIARSMGWSLAHQTNGQPGAAEPEHARIVVEDPCDAGTTAAMAGEADELVRVPVDADGLRTDLLPDGCAALIHVTPEHQRPLGVVLARDRRTALLRWAAQAGALILEEDIDGEVRYGDMTVPSLMSLDRSERVILLGGFGVSLGPWVDLAYLVLPRWLVPFARATRQLIDDSRGGLEHTALAGFLESGGYARHLHRLTKAYASRRDALTSALHRHLGEPARISGEHAGLHLAWYPPPDRGSPDALAALARRQGLDAAASAAGVVLLGFGTPDEHHIQSAVRQLAEALLAEDDGLPPGAAMTAGFAGSIAEGAFS